MEDFDLTPDERHRIACLHVPLRLLNRRWWQRRMNITTAISRTTIAAAIQNPRANPNLLGLDSSSSSSSSLPVVHKHNLA